MNFSQKERRKKKKRIAIRDLVREQVWHPQISLWCTIIEKKKNVKERQASQPPPSQTLEGKAAEQKKGRDILRARLSKRTGTRQSLARHQLP